MGGGSSIQTSKRGGGGDGGGPLDLDQPANFQLPVFRALGFFCTYHPSSTHYV